MSLEVYSVVGLRDLFNNPDKVWVVLATQSPQRSRIMKEHLGVTNILTMPSGFEEDLPKDEYTSTGEYCAATAEKKAQIVAKTLFNAKELESKTRVRNLLSSPFGKLDENFDVDKVHVVIGADTAADMYGVVYEKPVDREDAKRQITSYPEEWHNMHTGVAMFVRENGFEVPAKKFFTTTKIKFQKLSNEDVDALLDSREYEGSSGSYRITGLANSLIEEMVGSYTNVIGLPAQQVSSALCELAKTYNFTKL